MSYDEKLAEHVRIVLAKRNHVVEKNMFGGLCFMVGDAMCCRLTKTDFMIRVGAGQYADALAQPHTRPLVHRRRDGINDAADRFGQYGCHRSGQGQCSTTSGA